MQVSKKVVYVVLLLAYINSVWTMQEFSEIFPSIAQSHNEAHYKKLEKMFFIFWGRTALGIKERWEALKKGVEHDAIQTNIFPAISPFESSYVAYVSPSKDDKVQKMLFMYPSSTVRFEWIFKKFPGVKQIFCIAPVDNSIYRVYGWKQVEKIPEEITPNQKYFPPYDPKNLVPYVLNRDQEPIVEQKNSWFCIIQ